MIYLEFITNRIKGCLIVLTSLCFLLQGMLSQHCPKNKLPIKVCNHTDCRRLGISILQSANFRLDPCNDFYQYSCANFLSSTNLKPGTDSYSYISMMKERTEKRVRDLLEEEITDDDELLEIQAKLSHSVCLDTAKADRQETDLLENLLKNVGGWPMIKDSHEPVTQMGWDHIHNYFHSLTGVGSLINVLVYGDYLTHYAPTIHLDQPSTVFGRYSHIAVNKRKVYTQFLTDLVTDFITWTNSDAPREAVKRQVKEVMDFRYSLVNIMSWHTARRNETRKKNQVSFALWQELSNNHARSNNYTTLNWLQFVNDLFRNKIAFHSFQTIVVSEMGYLTNLLHLLNRTSKHTVVNHMHLHFIERHLIYMTKNLIERANKLNEAITGIPAVPERWKVCLYENPLQHIVARMYTKRYFSRNTIEIVGKIAEDIRVTLLNQIKNAPWMDIASKQMATKKLKMSKLVIGYPEFYDNQTMLNSLFRGLSVGYSNLQNALARGQNEFRLKALTLLGQKYDDNIENIPTEVNAFYDLSCNSLYVNAALLQWPIYSSHFPDTVLYATIGNIIGHEMGHAFDNVGRYFDQSGTSHNWWKQNSNKKYNENMQCLIGQYKSYANSIKNRVLIIPGENTAAENFADAVGMRASLEAFKRESRIQFEPMPKVSGLTHFSNVQIFYFASALVWCEKINSSETAHKIEYGDHSLNQFRVNGPISNTPEFSTAFNCKEDAAMNPSRKCNIWKM